MNNFKIICKCGSDEGDTFSCVQKDKGVEITYICRKCGDMETILHHLYNEDCK